MPLSTEIFVMCIFIAGWPFFYVMLKDPQLKSGYWFLISYTSLTFSNIFTVVEEIGLNYFFNLLEHFFITIASVFFIIAIVKLDLTSQKAVLQKENSKRKTMGDRK